MTTGPIELRLQKLTARLGWVPYFVLIMAIGGTILGAWFVADTGAEKDRARFENEVGATVEKITDRIVIYENLLRGGAGLLKSRPDLSAREFRRYVDALDLPRLYPGIQGIGYTVRVPKGEVGELEESMQQSHPGFHVWPPVDDSFVHAIKYLEPLDRRNREAIGYNMFSQATRRAAMERARDTARPAASGIVKLVQEIDEDIQAGFLIYFPLYEADETPTSLEERREQLFGFVYSPFRADDLLENIGPTEPAVAFRVFDGSEINEHRVLHTSAGWRQAAPGHRGQLTSTTYIRVGGRIWTIQVATLPGFISADSEINAGWIAVLGVLISLILFGLTRSQTRARVAAESALVNLRKSEKELRQSEARVRRLVDANIIGIVLGTGDGTINEANDAFLSMIGLSEKDFTEKTLTMAAVSAAPSADVAEYALTELVRKGQFGPYEHIFRRSDGSELPALIGMATVDGSSHDWVGFVLDLSEQKHMERQLLEQKETLETLNRVQQAVSAELEVSKVLAVVSRATGILTGADEASFFYRDPAAGSDHRSSISGAAPDRKASSVTREHPIVQRAFADITAEPEQQIDPEGEGVLAVPVVSRFGTVVGAIIVSRSSGGSFNDRDRQVVSGLAAQAAVAIDNANLYELARRDRNRAEQANIAKDQFLANLSHELRTPMTAIIGWIRMLQLGDLDDAEYEEAIEAISRSARAQAQLIEDILDVSRIATGKMKIQKTSIDLLEVIEAAVDSVWPSIESKRIELLTQLPDEPMPVSGDPHRLQQVMWNLLSNAIKFTDEGGTIELTAGHDDGTARISVRDSGEGIDPEAIPHIFERFRQADGTSTRTYGGLGLGLSLVDYIVRAHGGMATAESEGKGRGACFVIELPLETRRGEHVGLDAPLAESDLTLIGHHILLAEDDTEIRRMVRTILRHAGARVTGVRDAAQAIDHLVNEEFDVLVSDIAMPGQDGLALIRKVREGTNKNRSIPALALTAFASDEDRNRIMEAGYDGHLMKPLEPEELLRTIRKLVKRAESRNGE